MINVEKRRKKGEMNLLNAIHNNTAQHKANQAHIYVSLAEDFLAQTKSSVRRSKKLVENVINS